MCVYEVSRQVDGRNLEGISARHKSAGACVPAAGSSAGSRPSLMFGHNISEWRGNDQGRLPVAPCSWTLVFHRFAMWLLASPQLLSRLCSHRPKLPFYASLASSFRAFLIFTEVKPPSLRGVERPTKPGKPTSTGYLINSGLYLYLIFSYISCIVLSMVQWLKKNIKPSH